MQCSYCGAELSDNQKFCMCCGTGLEPRQQPEPETTAVTDQPDYMDDLQEWKEKIALYARPQTPAAPIAMEEKTQPRKTEVRQTGAPRLQLPTDRGLGKMIFLGLLTLGIYPTVIWSRIVTELNIAASRYDGQRTMPYFAACTLAPVTLSIYAWVWMHKFSNRVGAELHRRNIDYSFSAKTFWLWGVLGSLIIVGPFVYTHKLMQSMNRINEDFNVRG